MRSATLSTAAAAILVLTGAGARADEVALLSGGKLMGIATEEGDQVVVETAYGKVQVSRGMVLSIDRTKRSIVEEYRDIHEGTDLGDADQVFELARWARENGLSGHWRGLFHAVLELDSDHAGAREVLGYARFGGRWLTVEERMLAKGFVRDGAKWLTAAEHELMVRARFEESLRKEEEQRRKDEAKLAKAEKRRPPGWVREDVSPIIPTIPTGGPRRDAPGYVQYGGYGYVPTAGVIRLYDPATGQHTPFGFYGFQSFGYGWAPAQPAR